MTTPLLTAEQQAQIFEACRVGCQLRDALIVAGLDGSALDEALKDSRVVEIAQRARAEGAQAVRKSLTEAVRSGNVSAARVLALHKDQEKADEDGQVARQAMSDAEFVALMKRVTRSIERSMAHQRAMLELEPNE